MKLTQKKNLELNDTVLPNIFISNYIQNLQQDDLKVYIYLLFLNQNDISFSEKDICKKLGITENELSFCLDRLQTIELIQKNEYGYNITDLKEKELNKVYVPKIEPKKTKQQTEQEQKRIAAATAINESFFQGIMSLGWYTDISLMFEKYMFSEEVMIALFHYCQERKALNRKYVFAVAENWYKGEVKTFEQLEDYLEKLDKVRTIEQKISKALRLNRNITEYEEKYILKWINEYNYDFDMIEEALKRTVNKSAPSINYINGILNNWYNNGYKTVDDIKNNLKKDDKSVINKSAKETNAKSIKYKSYEQRNYDDLDLYYDNLK